MRDIMAYDGTRMRRALVHSGVPEESLDDYVQKRSSPEVFYTFNDRTQNDLAIDVLESRYLSNDEPGPLQMWDRLSRAMATVEKTPEAQEFWYNKFLGILLDFKFIPGGRVMHGAGRTEVRREATLSNCYVIPLTWGYSAEKLEDQPERVREAIMGSKREGLSFEEAVLAVSMATRLEPQELSDLIYCADSLDAIYQNLSQAASVYRTGGGVGTDLSELRPKGAYVNSTIDVAPGPTGFMNILSESTEAVAQQGRRGALMLTMRVSHPSIRDFIKIKSDAGRSKVKHANVSVLVDDEFMKAVEKGANYTLWWENKDPLSSRYGERIEEVVDARELWNEMITSAHASAEPGIIFWDRMREFHNGEYVKPLESTNPCGEQPLASYTSCNLGNLNLAMFVDNEGNFDYGELAEASTVATRFLDDVITYNQPNHALETIKRAVDADRRTGLGITGLAEAFVRMGIKYDTQEAVDTADKIMRTIRDSAYITSVRLAKERGPFPLFDWDGISQSRFIQSLPEGIQAEIREHGLRNVTLLTVPPVGTGSIVAQTSSGIEPIFSTSYRRRVKQEGGGEKEYKVVEPVIKRTMGDDESLPEHVITAHQVDPYFRVKLQGVIQRYVDTAISSTINLDQDIALETVGDIYRTAHKEGLKGVTVYREGSRQGILETEDHAKKGTVDLEGIVEVEKPQVIEERNTSSTYSIRTGEGKLHITITGDERGYPTGVFNNLGPIGTSQSSAAALEGLRLTRYLEEVPEPDLLRTLRDFGNIKSDRPLGYGPNRVDSLQHGFSIVWRYHLLKKGVIVPNGESGLKQITFKNIDNDADLSELEEAAANHSKREEQQVSGGICKECGSSNTRPPEGGCKEPTCLDCGDSKCN